MNDLPHLILKASKDEIAYIFEAAQKRYQELFPEWEITTVSVDRSRDRNVQIDEMIRLLDGLRRS